MAQMLSEEPVGGAFPMRLRLIHALAVALCLAPLAVQAEEPAEEPIQLIEPIHTEELVPAEEPVQAEDTAALAQAHLASYRSEAAAQRGWQVLAAQYSGLLQLEQAIVEVDLPGKGHFYRLYAVGDQDMVTRLCRSLKKRKLACDLNGR